MTVDLKKVDGPEPFRMLKIPDHLCHVALRSNPAALWEAQREFYQNNTNWTMAVAFVKVIGKRKRRKREGGRGEEGKKERRGEESSEGEREQRRREGGVGREEGHLQANTALPGALSCIQRPKSALRVQNTIKRKKKN